MIQAPGVFVTVSYFHPSPGKPTISVESQKGPATPDRLLTGKGNLFRPAAVA